MTSFHIKEGVSECTHTRSYTHIDKTHTIVFNLREFKEVLGFPGGSDSKASARNAGDLGSIPGLGRLPGEGNGNPLQYSCLENPMDGGPWCRLLSHGVTKSRARLSDFTFAFTPLWCAAFSLRWLHLLQSMGSRAHGLCSCGTQV